MKVFAGCKLWACAGVGLAILATAYGCGLRGRGSPLTIPAHSGPVCGLAFDPSGLFLASAGADNLVRIWDLRSLRSSWSASVESSGLEKLVFSPDGRDLAARVRIGAGEAKVNCYIWNSSTARLEQFLTSAQIPSWANQPRPQSSGKFHVICDNARSPTKLWLSDAAAGRTVGVAGNFDQINDWLFARGGSVFVTASGYTDNPWPVSRSGDVRVWDCATGVLLARLTPHRGAVTRVALSPDGETLASGGFDGTVSLWRVADILGEKKAAKQ